MKQTFVFTRPAMSIDPGAKIEFLVVAHSAESAREVLKAELRRATLNVGGFPVPIDIAKLWTNVEPVAISNAGAHESVGIVGVRSEGLTSRDHNG